MPDPTPFFVTLALAAFTAAVPQGGGGLSPAPTPTTPAGAVRTFARAYSDESLEALGALLSGDFGFYGNDARVAPYLPKLLDRDRELRIASNIFNGVSRDGKVVMPGADSVSITVGELAESPDPEHPDSTDHYRLVAVHRFESRIHRAGLKDFTSLPALHVFHVVRGDAAILVAGQPADSTRWYVRRWFEDVNGLAAALDKVQGECDQADSTLRSKVRPTASLPLAIHPLGNPACPTLDIACDLPGSGPARLEVFDVMGRRMNHQEFDVAASGTIKLHAGAGVRLTPGAYWVRLTQAAHHSTRMVVVAR